MTRLPATRHDAANYDIIKGYAALRSGYWQDLTTTDFGRVDPERTVALLPVAAVEQHGPHLPLSTDALINDGIVRAALERLPAGHNAARAARAERGLEPRAHELRRHAVDSRLAAARRVDRHRPQRGAHGAAQARSSSTRTAARRRLVDLVAVRLRSELGMLVVRATYFAFGALPGLFDPAEIVHDIHGGEVETSLLLHLRPDLVRTAALADFKGLPHELAARHKLLGAEKPVGIGWRAEDLNPAGACGNAARADGRRGAQHLSYLADRLAGSSAKSPRRR